MLIVHIGMHKAGSSSVQAFLSENAARLAERGLAYPEAGRPAVAHHDLSLALKERRIAPEWAGIAALARTQPVVLSSETFCACDPALLAEAADGAPVRILCWQRNAAEGIVSRYAQMTKRARNLDAFDDFLAQREDSDQLLVAPLLGRWAEVFGLEAIRVRSLDAEVLAKGELICDLLDALGLEDDETYVRPGQQNISPGWRALETIRSLNLQILGAGEADDRALRFVRKAMPRAIARAEQKLGLYQRGAYLNPDQAQRLVERYNADIAALEASGMDARLKPLALDAVSVSDAPLTEASVPRDEALALLRAAMVELASEDFRTWR